MTAPTRLGRRAAGRRAYHLDRIHDASGGRPRLAAVYDYLRSMLALTSDAPLIVGPLVVGLLELARLDAPTREAFHRGRAVERGRGGDLSAALDSLRTGMSAMSKADARAAAEAAAELLLAAAERLAEEFR